MLHVTPPEQERINLSAPHMTGLEREALMDAFDSNWIAPAGPALNEFEEKLRAISQTEAAVALNSGTAALHLALLVLDIGPGDVVLCPSVTFVASANVIKYVGAVPHFVDCDPSTGNIDTESLEQALESLTAAGHRPSALITVDLYGSCADYSTIAPICKRFDVPIVEDAAEAIGATHAGRPAGSFGELAAFSFNGNKLITTGGGGALVGRADLIERAAYLAGQARQPELHFEHHEIGYAYRLSNLSAALGCAQLDRLESMISRTHEIHHRYLDELTSIAGVTLAAQDIDGRGNGWLTVAHLDQAKHCTPADVCEALLSQNIEVRPAWKPMHLQALYSDASITGGTGAEEHFRSGLCLPSGSSMSVSDQSRVIAALKTILQGSSESSASIDIADRIDVRDVQPQQRLGSRPATH